MKATLLVTTLIDHPAMGAPDQSGLAGAPYYRGRFTGSSGKEN
jgi:hypothetical protein